MAWPTVSVEIGVADSAATGDWWHVGDPSRGVIGTAAVGPDVLWADVTADVRSISTQRGSTRLDGPIVHYDAGTCTVELDNRSRKYDPTNLGGPYADGVTSRISPMRPIRVRATSDGTTYDIWRGFVDAWQQSYDQSPNMAVTTVTATDATKVLARGSRVAVAAVGAGEDSGARVSRILDSIGWGAEDRVIAVGDSTLQATTLEGDALSELVSVQDSEIGELLVDAAGRITFRNRRGILTDYRSAVAQAVFGDDGVVELPYTSVTPEHDDTALANLVRATREGGVQQEVSDAASIAAHLLAVHEQSGLLLQTDAAALDWAGFVLHQSKDPELRFAEIVVNPRNSSDTLENQLFGQVLGREIGDRITIVRRPPGGGDPIERDVFIRGIGHEIGADLTWTCTWVLQSATKFAFFTVGDPLLGSIGDNALAF